MVIFLKTLLGQKKQEDISLIIKKLLLKNYISLVLFLSGLCIYFLRYHVISIVLTSFSIISASAVFFYITFFLEWSDESIKAILPDRDYLIESFKASLMRYLYYIDIKGDSREKEQISIDGAFFFTRRIILIYFITCWVGSAAAFAVIFLNFSNICNNSFYSIFRETYVTEFIDLLYLSFAIITTLGSSEIIPVGSYYVKYFCVSESILGVFLMGLGITYLFLGFNRLKLMASGMINMSYKYYDKYDGNKTLLREKVINYYKAKEELKPEEELKECEEQLAYELEKYGEYVRKKLPDFRLFLLLKRFLGF